MNFHILVLKFDDCGEICLNLSEGMSLQGMHPRIRSHLMFFDCSIQIMDERFFLDAFAILCDVVTTEVK